MNDDNKSAPANITDEEWKEKLSPEQYRVTRKAGTEAPFSHEYNDNKRDGTYQCVCCGADLFPSGTKYNSGTGWPSFYAPAGEDSLSQHEDRALFRSRTEVRCNECDAHLGHVFPDGPKPTGLRYCINGQALDFSTDSGDADNENQD